MPTADDGQGKKAGRFLLSEESGSATGNPPGAAVVRFHRLREHDGKRSYEEASLAVDRLPDLKGPVGDYSLPRLAKQYGVTLGTASESLRSIPAPAGIARLIGVARGAPILRLERVVRTAAGQPIEWRVLYWRE